MIRIPAGNLFAAASALGSSCKFFQIGRRQLIAERAPAMMVDLAQMSVVLQAATVLKRVAGQLGLVACQAAAERLERVGDWMNRRIPKSAEV